MPLGFIFNIGGPEMFVLLVIGVLLFGRDLPQVGRTLGKTMAQLRRGFQDFKDQMDRDETFRDVKKTADDVRQAARLPAAVANPGRMLRDLTNEALYSPAPGEAARSPADPADADKDANAQPTDAPGDTDGEPNAFDRPLR